LIPFYFDAVSGYSSRPETHYFPPIPDDEFKDQLKRLIVREDDEKKFEFCEPGQSVKNGYRRVFENDEDIDYLVERIDSHMGDFSRSVLDPAVKDKRNVKGKHFFFRCCWVVQLSDCFRSIYRGFFTCFLVDCVDSIIANGKPQILPLLETTKIDPTLSAMAFALYRELQTNANVPFVTFLQSKFPQYSVDVVRDAVDKLVNRNMFSYEDYDVITLYARRHRWIFKNLIENNPSVQKTEKKLEKSWWRLW
jgi:hypothetical protein